MIPQKGLIDILYSARKHIGEGIQTILLRLKNIPTYLSEQKPQFQAMRLSVHRFSEIAEEKIQDLGRQLREFVASKKASGRKQTNDSPFSGRQKYFNEEWLPPLPASPPEETEPQKEVLIEQFKDSDGNVFCTEQATRARTMSIFKEQLNAERKYLVEQLGEKDADEAAIIRRIQHIDEKRAAYSATTATWASSNTPRYLFRQYGPEAKKKEIPLLANLRSHSVEFVKTGEKSTTNRSGAISDFAHPETNLMEMEDYLILTDGAQANDPIHFADYYHVHLGEPGAKDRLIGEIKQRLEKAYGVSDPDKIRALLSERRTLLRTLLLQDLYVHFQAKPADNPSTFFGRVALLDPEKKAVTESSGYQLNERNQLLDMKMLYDELDGAKVVFDLQSGMYFDDEGVIHMPKTFATENLTQTGLRTLLVNVCVQGHRKNKGLQQTINNAALQKMETLEIHDQDYVKLASKLRKSLLQKKTSFETSHRTIQFMNAMGRCSVDCYGGKDRTGYAMALEIYHLIRKHIKNELRAENKNATLSKKEDTLMAKIAHQLIGPTAIIRKIIEENSAPGITAVKVTIFNLELYFTGPALRWICGLGKRIAEYGRGLSLVAKTKFKKPPANPDKTLLYNE